MTLYETKATWNSGTLKMEFLSGKLLGNTYKIKGEMLDNGHFLVFIGMPFVQISPIHRSISADEESEIINALRNNYHEVEF